jgi:uncharacterized protein (TIGR02594 family)
MAAAPDFGPMQPRRRVRMRGEVAASNVPPWGSSYPSTTVRGPVIERPVRRLQRRPVQVASNDPGSYGAGMSFGGATLVAEARRWIGGNPTGRSSLWCGNFMNFVLNRTGNQTSPSNTARSFASYGHRLPGPQVGAIAVMSRGHGGGHVGVVSGIDPSGNPIIISGNHGRRVGEGVYPRGRIYAYVSP